VLENLTRPQIVTDLSGQHGSRINGLDPRSIIAPLRRRSRTVILTCTVAVLVSVAALESAALWWGHRQPLRAAELRAANLSFVLSEYIRGSVAVADTSLRQLALHGRRVGGAAAPASAWDDILKSARAAMPAGNASSISVADQHGVIRHSTRADIVGESRRDQYIFRHLSTVAADDLVIDAPFLVQGEQGSRYILPIGRRLSAADGSFGGVVVTTFEPDAFTQFFRTLDVGDEGVVSIFHPDGVVVFRVPATAGGIGQPAAGDPLLLAAQASGGKGLTVGSLSGGGPDFISAYDTLKEPPLIVAVSLRRSEVLADWRAHFLTSVLALGALTLSLGAIVLVLVRQISARLRAEEELSQLQQVEANRLRETNEQLEAALDREQRARRDAEAASRLKDEFLMTLSHELRTPLAAIYGWVRMLATGIVPLSEHPRALATVERNAQAQTRLIDDLLDVSRAISGKLRLDRRATQPHEVVRAAIDTVAPALEAKGIQLVTDIDETTGTILADPDRLQQIVWNLLSNALKFTPNDGTVRLSVSRHDSIVEIAVADNGIGIHPEFVPYVFDRFRQAEAGTRRRFGGLGLGLAIVRHLVELHGGQVRCESAGEGHGATFRVLMPARTGRRDSSSDQQAASIARRAARLDGVRVLVVDDETDARELFGSILRGAGASVETADSASAGLAQLAVNPPQVLVSDLEMPGKDGYQLLREARGRSHPARPLIAVAVTAHAREADKQRALDAGFDWHFSKPVEAADLVGVIASLVAPVNVR
jgi:signal transduction histidine kinase/CheY-like chemotaxis protein